MSRRHKTAEELERIQSRKRESQGDCSQEVVSNGNRTTNDKISLDDFVITKKGSDKKCYALDIVVGAISRSLTSLKILDLGRIECFESSFENTFKKQVRLTEQIQQAIIGAIEAQEESEETDNIAKRGRRKIQQLLGKFKNTEVVSWFDRIRVKFNKVVESLKELMTCFFCAVFDMIPSESRHGKATCFYEMIKAHMKDKIPKEKIPSESMFQKALKWFKGWRIEVAPWKNKQAEEEEHSIWERLYQLILKELPFIEPRLAYC